MAQVMISYRVPETGSKSLGGDGTVDRLADALKSRGFSVFVGEQEDGLRAGEEWAKGIQNAVLSCQAMVVLCSETYGATPWTFREISLADRRRMAQRNVPASRGEDHSWNTTESAARQQPHHAFVRRF